MTLLDTTDSILMLGAYGWAFIKPIRKLYYNLTITAVSVIVAVIVGGFETLNLIRDQLARNDFRYFFGRRCIAAASGTHHAVDHRHPHARQVTEADRVEETRSG